MYKPEHHNSLSPYLIIADAQVELDFIEAVFDVEPSLVVKGQGDRIQHAEVRIDDSVLMMGEAPGGTPANIHIYVPNVAESFAKAKAAGGTVVQEPVQKDDADLRGGIASPAGTVWWISTHQG